MVEIKVLKILENMYLLFESSVYYFNVDIELESLHGLMDTYLDFFLYSRLCRPVVRSSMPRLH